MIGAALTGRMEPRPMRILHLNELYPPMVLGGAERSVAALAEAQARAGHDVAVTCINDTAFVDEMREGVRVLRVPHETAFWGPDWQGHPPLVRFWRRFSLPYNRRQRGQFARVLDMVRPDIVHTHSMNDVSTGCWIEAARRGIKIVHTLRNYDLLCANGAMYHNGRPCGLRCRVVSLPKQRHHHVIDGVIGISDDILRVHRDHGTFAHLPPERQRIIWNSARVAGAGPDYRKPDRTGASFAFGFLGRLTEEKGIGVLIEAARRLPLDGSWELVVAGRAPGKDNPFAAMAAGLPVRFLGQVEPLTLFEQIDLLVAPSIWAEPFGRIVIEAYSVGVPVVVADSGGLPGLIAGDRANWVVPPRDVDALADRIRGILRAGRAGLPAPATFDTILARTMPESIAGQYCDFYADVTGGQGQGR